MAFGISGFGGLQVQAVPQPFQALALGGGVPHPPAQPYGTPNLQSLVPVRRTSSTVLPLDLMLQTAQNIAAIVARTNAVPPSPPLSTAFVGARDVLFQARAPAPNPYGIIRPPAPPVSFGVTAPLPERQVALGVVTGSLTTPPLQPVRSDSSGDPKAATPSSQDTGTPAAHVPVLSPAARAFLSTVAQLRIAEIYPQPFFSVAA